MKVSRDQAVALAQTKKVKKAHTEVSGYLLVMSFAAGRPVDHPYSEITL